MALLSTMLAACTDVTAPQPAVDAPTSRARTAAAWVRWSVVPLGTLGGEWSEATAINDLNVVVGRSAKRAGDARPFLWTRVTGMVDLGSFGGDDGAATDVNDRKEIVGYSTDADGVRRAFIWRAGSGLTDLGDLGGTGGSEALAINDRGVVVGRSSTTSGETHAFIWSQTTGMIDLEGAGGVIRVIDIDNDGTMVGTIGSQSPVARAFRRTPGGAIQEFDTPFPFGERVEAVSRGQAAGCGHLGFDSAGDVISVPFLTNGVNHSVIGNLGGPGCALGVNEVGQVVGFDFDPAGGCSCGVGLTRPFAWSRQTGILALPFTDEGEAVAINRSGVIAGFVGGQNRPRQATLWIAKGGAFGRSRIADVPTGR
jgi:probable HAF family extracellular repeat protein